METPPPPSVEHGAAGRPFAGERASGDAYLVETLVDGVLAAVVDGLGHGEEAAAAAAVAIGVLKSHADEPLAPLIRRCHEALQSTRGVALALVHIDVRRDRFSWAGIGNVEAVLFVAAPGAARRNICLLNQGGVVGYRLPAVQVREETILPGDVLILATDGIDCQFMSQTYDPAAPAHLARLILDRYGKASDDSLVLVLRRVGSGTDFGADDRRDDAPLRLVRG